MEQVTASKAGAAGCKFDMVMKDQRSKATSRLNLPNARPGDKYAPTLNPEP